MPQLTHEPTICFDVDEAQWLHLALQMTLGLLAHGLLNEGVKPDEDEAFEAYTRLERRCREFWLANTRIQ